MGQPSWTDIAKVKVPERPGCIWTPALDYVTPGKLYRITVALTAANPPVEQTWTLETGEPCGADGDASVSRNAPTLLNTCPVGALIGKIGGSSADSPPDAKQVFAVGRHCVFSVPLGDATKPAISGTLYLAVNEVAPAVAGLAGQLEVTISTQL